MASAWGSAVFASCVEASEVGSRPRVVLFFGGEFQRRGRTATYRSFDGGPGKGLSFPDRDGDSYVPSASSSPFK